MTACIDGVVSLLRNPSGGHAREREREVEVERAVHQSSRLVEIVLCPSLPRAPLYSGEGLHLAPPQGTKAVVARVGPDAPTQTLTLAQLGPRAHGTLAP
jgi:hypothetical protein